VSQILYSLLISLLNPTLKINPVDPNQMAFYPFDPSNPLNSEATFKALGSSILQVLSLLAVTIKLALELQSIE